MKRKLGLILVTFLFSCNNMNQFNPPLAKRIPKILEKHGHTRIDDFYWLNERDNPEVIAYLKAENEYAEKVLSHTKKLQEQLYEEMKARIKEDDESVPFRLGNYYYYYRYEVGKEYPIHCRKKESLEGKEEILLDVNEIAKGHKYCVVTSLTVSTNENLLAFAVDTVGRRIFSIRFKNLRTGEILPYQIEHTTGNVVWANDNQTVFYTVQDKQTLRSYRVYRHILGSAPSEDVLVYEEQDDAFYVSVNKSKSRQYIFIISNATLSSEVRYFSADDPTSQPVLFHPREPEHEYAVYHYKDKFYIHTNWQAQNFRLMETSINNTDKSKWKEVIPHRKDTLLESVEIFENYLVLEERTRALSYFRVRRWEDSSEYYIPFNEQVYSISMGNNPEFQTDLFRFTYNSLTTPPSVYDYNMKTQTRELKKRLEILGGYNPEEYYAERLWATAPDGVQVPISLVYKKGTLLDGSAPLYLTGYGAYGISYDPYFSSARISLLNRGFIFAIAHVRGGQELGRQWYEDGKLFKKKNTFTDFIACAETLINKRYTSPAKLCINGGSAGGLLVGAVINMRPELFKACIADVPFVDVVTTMLDESIPLTTGEYDEWGNPNEKSYYEYMLSYSPYDNVRPQNYPHLLVNAALHDSQVQYWEPAKWVAKLRITKTDNNMLLLYTNMEAGHSGVSGRFAPLKEVAMEYAFLFEVLEIKE
ncbi:MAG: S9 family peptidase [Cytophagales bacterium]|nr:S9 family peptidase [Cytophagales bacterium]MDW8384629.1 S9 family peptidase [Flammeovirgaceae bacterium]